MPASNRMSAPARALTTLSIALATVAAVGAAPANAAPTVVQTQPVGSQVAAKTASAKTIALKAASAKKKLTKAQKRKAAQKRHAKIVSRKARTGLAIARKQLGDPYRWGGAGPNAFDCSGLVQYSFHRAGFRGVPRTSRAQAAHTKRIARSQMKPGDLMFFYGSSGVYHAAVFAGRKNGRVVMVHAPGTGRRVTYASPWTDAWFAGTLRR